MAISGLVAGGVQSALDDVLDRRMREQIRQQQERQHAAELAQRQAEQAAQQANQLRLLDLNELKHRDDNNRRGMELMQGDKAQMDEESFMASLPPEARQIVNLRRRGVNPADLISPEQAAATKATADRAAFADWKEKQDYDEHQIRTRPKESSAATKPEYEWVIGADGKPRQSVKGQALPGDAPYRAPMSTSETLGDRQRVARIDAAQGFLERLNTLREKINTKMGPQAGLGGLARRGAAGIGLDPEVAEYQRTRAAGGRALAVAIMGAQNLSDADAEAWANMLPDATTDKDTALRLTTQVEKMLTGMTGTDATTPFSVKAPNGKTYTFKSAAELAAFKAKAGIQ